MEMKNRVATNEVIARVNNHNKHCQKVEEMWMAEYVVPANEVDMDEEVEEGEKRYLTFEWAEA